MNNSRRWLKLLALLSVLLLTFAACGEEESTDAGSDFTLVSDGTLTVGSDIPYPPFEFNADDDGSLTGFDVELVREIATRVGLENTDDDWLSVDFGTFTAQLKSGTKFDIMVAAVTGYAPEGSPASEVVADRTAVIDFSVPYYDSLQSLTVNTSNRDDLIEGLDDIPDGSRVAVQSATTGAFYAEANIASEGIELVEFNKAPGMYQALLSGQVDAVFNDLPVSLEAIADTPELQVVEQVETGEQYGIAVAKDNAALKDAIDGALKEMFEDGTYAEIFNTYFPEQELPDYASE
jgi:polar amino acid transport system substrate-binding protein